MTVISISAGLVILVAVGCALSWLTPSQISKIILPARTSYGTIDRHKEKKREPLQHAFFVLSFLGWSVIYYTTFYELLAFLPDHWGSFRSGIAGTASTVLSVFTLVQLEKLNAAYVVYQKAKAD